MGTLINLNVHLQYKLANKQFFKFADISSIFHKIGYHLLYIIYDSKVKSQMHLNWQLKKNSFLVLIDWSKTTTCAGEDGQCVHNRDRTADSFMILLLSRYIIWII